MEGCLKLARQYFYQTGQPQRKHFVARHLSYHGNTLGTLAVAHNLGRRAPYEAILNQDVFHHVSPAYYKRFKYENETEAAYVARLAEELEAKFQELGPQNVIGSFSFQHAVVAETVVGATTGVVAAPKGYFKAMKEVAHRHGALFILDEEWVLFTLGKALETAKLLIFKLLRKANYGGVSDLVRPRNALLLIVIGVSRYAAIGAVLMNKRVANGIRDRNGYWQHGHTYQAHPLSCAASLAVQEVIRKENLLENNLKQGAYLASLLRQRLESPNALAKPYIFDIRGGGLWYAVEFEVPPEKMGTHKFALVVQAKCLEKGLIIMGFTGGANLQGTKGDHCMLSPAYNITKEQVDSIVDIFVESIEETIKEFKF
ncbi:hypothetical protein Clacol_005096 [Clathrus columnatus]|uniref:Uncharacterized protein n=1 Tax=Clathrus columnatus TaxID=1419009 RepID=A0AAV5ACK3_9AGAM|nr:hypothetical protein Clacol_005096 [Clathrus columnatus]